MLLPDTEPIMTGNDGLFIAYIDVLVKDHIISSASAMKILKSCTKPSMAAKYTTPIIQFRNTHKIWGYLFGRRGNRISKQANGYIIWRIRDSAPGIYLFISLKHPLCMVITWSNISHHNHVIIFFTLPYLTLLVSMSLIFISSVKNQETIHRSDI